MFIQMFCSFVTGVGFLLLVLDSRSVLFIVKQWKICLLQQKLLWVLTWQR